MNYYYLAYGSNLNVNQMKRRCPRAKIVGSTIIDDYRLMFKGSKTGAYLTIEKEKECRVPVGVWIVDDYDLARLDAYEGYPAFYYRKRMKVQVMKKDGTRGECEALVYIMHEDRKLGCPTDIYMYTCLEGYEDFRFDKDYLIDAYSYSIKGAEDGNNK